MAFDFPASPSVGASFNPGVGKPTYIWDGEKWGVGPQTAAQQRAAIYAAPIDSQSYNNILVNGPMEVNQEGITSTVTHGANFCDQWFLYKLGTMVSYTRQLSANPGNPIPGTGYYMEIETQTAQPSIGAADATGIYCVIEGFRAAKLAFGTSQMLPMVLCFWSGHARTGIYSGSIRSVGTTYCYVFEYTQAVSNVWQYNVIPILANPNGGIANLGSGQGLVLNLTMAAGTTLRSAAGNWQSGTTGVIASNNQINGCAATSDRFHIGGVILLPGTDAPPQERAHHLLRPYQDELRLCQRYLEVGNFSVQSVSSSAMTGRGYTWPIPFRENKRATPTMTFFNTTATRCSTPSAVATQPDGFSVFTSNNLTGGDDFFASGSFKADARLT